MRLILAFSSLLLILSPCLGWWDTGHMLVAKVAQITLRNRNSKALELAETITSVMNPFSHEKITNLVESAVWPDDIKGYKVGIMDPWHYLDVPVRLDDPSDPHTHIFHKPNDSASLLKTAMSVLTKWSKWERNNLQYETLEKSMMLRYLVHVVGDVHQPLHSAELIDEKKFPKGDMGGNLFEIQYNPPIVNLHEFWDSVADNVPNNLARPLNQTSNETLESLALSFMEEHHETEVPYMPSIQTPYPFDDWISESNLFAQNFVYKMIKPEERITEEYKAKAFDICRQRIAYGGYRLAKLIEIIYEKYDKIETTTEEKFLS